MCMSNLIAYILQMSQRNVFNCTYSGTKLLNSYPPFKTGEVGVHVTLWYITDIICHEMFSLLMNRTHIYGACVKAEQPDHLDQQK